MVGANGVRSSSYAMKSVYKRDLETKESSTKKSSERQVSSLISLSVLQREKKKTSTDSSGSSLRSHLSACQEAV